MPETERLTRLARAQLQEGRLPGQIPTTALGGLSVGAVCGLCSGPIAVGAPEIELVWSGGAIRRSVMLHPACHAAWLGVSRLPESQSS